MTCDSRGSCSLMIQTVLVKNDLIEQNWRKLWYIWIHK